MALFIPDHRISAPAERPARARLNLDETQGTAVPGDDIDLAEPRPEIPRDAAISLPRQIRKRKIFALFTQTTVCL